MKWKLIPLVLVAVLFFAASSSPATAQDSEADNTAIVVDLEGATGSLNIKQEVQTQAKVELVVGDQIYQLTVPITVQIDATKPLTDANVTVPAVQQVGSFAFEPVSVEVLEGDYEQSFRSVTPSSSDNVVVVYTANITSLHNAPVELSYSSNLLTAALDDAGNRYEEEQRSCDEIAPGEKITCEFVYDVPASANLVDLDVSAFGYKVFSFPQGEPAE